jgi:galactokinase
MNNRELITRFGEMFGNSEDVRMFFAPGRINLIGEHIDYNGGIVFPCALNAGTTAVVRKRNDGMISFASVNFSLRKEIPVSRIVHDMNDGWMNYPKGIVSVLQGMGYDIGGFDVLYYGNIPNGSGLSSSASIEIVTALMINSLFSLGIPMIDLVKISKKAENEFVGVNCGIMDMFAIGMGKKEMAIALDCNTLEFTYIPVRLQDYSLVIANSNKRRGLADSKYNERRSECERALAILKQYVNAEYLCDIPIEAFERYKDRLNEDLLVRRARHVITENNRVKEAIRCLSEKNDIMGFGKLMNESHISLRDDYDVTGIELDTLVGESWKVDGVVGSRMTGAGFGGCTVSIVKNDIIDIFKDTVGKKYREKTGLTAEFYAMNLSGEAGEIDL